MARARNIKPGFYKNEQLAECSVWARFIFPGLWMLADREGRLEDRPKRIKAELLPFDTQDAEPLLAELHTRGFIHRYAIDGVRYLQIIAFKKHQTPHYSEKQSDIKPPELPEFTGDIERKASKSQAPMKKAELPESTKSEARMKRGSQPPDSLNPDSLNPESRKPQGAGAPPFVLPDWVTADDWQAFEAMRKQLRKPLTPRAKELVIRELDRLRGQGHAPSAVLQQSIRKGWQDVYPVKADQLALAPPGAGPSWRGNAL